ncbi:class I SAM-dependent methyltransferase [Marixanthomonas ophiurae]|uniref:Class I SAM-dependent methyltransferase n=1 Tax=Marixanthomonas ophiurae TaxID=387659 RepID=A0A3E1Q8U3_9FLAO|nr:class I SAM-dependent methyltransferase [Marixanthomonas ophiurae]RFN58540.1 class I SAM-dependent methyltransferase [Marixanthomonas ophiurae]
MTDIIGTALLDYYHGKYTEDILTETNITEEDVMPLPYLFRSYAEMPQVEQKALDLSYGKTLDVGCGAGSHSLHLQEQELKVTAIDTSKGAVEVCKLRGVDYVEQIDLLELENKKFDTILLLMNGTGIFQKLEFVSKYLQKLKSLLTSKGQILIDSSDLKYLWDAAEDEGVFHSEANYYGELEFVMKYKGEESAPFSWIYLDETLFKKKCHENEFNFEIVHRGNHHDYLAKLTNE